jgi:hypothetical protein
MAFTIPTTGFCIHIMRRRQEQRAGIAFPRTVSDYECYWSGALVAGLTGQMVERGGPGNNGNVGVNSGRRILEGSYPLAIQKGNHYETYNYEEDHLLPGLLLTQTVKRVGILIQPCHDSKYQYLSSIGCINPAQGLETADSRVDLEDSEARVIALIDTMKRKLGARFPKTGKIPGAVVVIEGEPA